ncbi:MAG TPA: PhaM family polyhydroxyalkanoate granule multifunctional regulatory protein [Burkholderiaceae bacterium]|nr:PhaM family polyhydroxyalkanoate granule multifunctional regulatory protein [Burkholderiaceae bacterium]
MNDASGPGSQMPGFDFLRQLGAQAGSAVPPFSQWIAPTLDPQELDKRIAELKAVQFWLEQNAKMLAATVQAMEVQRMTLATLQTMNVPLEQMREAFMARAPSSASGAPRPSAGAGGKDPAPTAAPLVDPMQWWSALTQQFATLASRALGDTGAAAPATGPGEGAAAGPPPAGRERPAGSAGTDATAQMMRTLDAAAEFWRQGLAPMQAAMQEAAQAAFRPSPQGPGKKAAGTGGSAPAGNEREARRGRAAAPAGGEAAETTPPARGGAAASRRRTPTGSKAKR